MFPPNNGNQGNGGWPPQPPSGQPSTPWNGPPTNQGNAWGAPPAQPQQQPQQHPQQHPQGAFQPQVPGPFGAPTIPQTLPGSSQQQQSASPFGAPFGAPQQGGFAMVPVQAANPYAPQNNSGKPRTFIERYPRVTGVLLTGLGALLVGWMQSMIETDGHYYPKALFLGSTAIPLGLWLTIAGQPKDPITNQPRTWWRIASGLVVVLSLIFGGMLSWYITHPE